MFLCFQSSIWSWDYSVNTWKLCWDWKSQSLVEKYLPSNLPFCWNVPMRILALLLIFWAEFSVANSVLIFCIKGALNDTSSLQSLQPNLDVDTPIIECLNRPYIPNSESQICELWHTLELDFWLVRSCIFLQSNNPKLQVNINWNTQWFYQMTNKHAYTIYIYSLIIERVGI